MFCKLNQTFCSVLCRCLSDGTGQLNQAGVDHYNNFINALVANGTTNILNLSFKIPLFIMFLINRSKRLWLCRNSTICNTIPLGSSSSLGWWISRMAKSQNHVCNSLIHTFFLHRKDFWVLFDCGIVTEMTLQFTLRHVFKSLVTVWRIG